ncbi:MAG: hydroxyethylthiazole kinase [Polyangiales bacterium]
MIEQHWEAVERIRANAPLVHNITNYVVMNTTANALLAIGASPLMAHAPEEIDELLGLASALVVNIGTLSSPWIAAMRLAARRAGEIGKPWVLDPVGVGASLLRTSTAASLLALRPSVVRGNGSEILALGGAVGAVRGVDSTQSSSAAIDVARTLAQRTGSVIAVTGAVDYVTDGTRVVEIAQGVPLMSRVTGLGCTASALIGAFLAVKPNPLDAAASALTVFGVAAEVAAERAEGPGTLQLHLLDALHRIDEATLRARVRTS